MPVAITYLFSICVYRETVVVLRSASLMMFLFNSEYPAGVKLRELLAVMKITHPSTLKSVTTAPGSMRTVANV